MLDNTDIEQSKELLQPIQKTLESHGAMLKSHDKLVPKSRVEELEEDVKLLKIAIRQLDEGVQALKKAM